MVKLIRHQTIKAGLLVAAFSASCGQQPTGRTETVKPNADEVEGLQIEEFRSARISRHPRLVLVLHGDAPFSKPAYQYKMAELIAAENDDVVAVGLLRPGYTDANNHRSTGTKGEATGDNYTPVVVDAVATALRQLRGRYQADKVILVGHSGGAAIAANLLGRHPGIAQAAVLVSCPCNVPQWRQHMLRLQGGATIWEVPVSSISPLAVASGINPETRVSLVVGTADSVTPPRFSREYQALLTSQGMPATVIEVPGAGHEILLTEPVRQQVRILLRQLR